MDWNFWMFVQTCSSGIIWFFCFVSFFVCLFVYYSFSFPFIWFLFNFDVLICIDMHLRSRHPHNEFRLSKNNPKQDQNPYLLPLVYIWHPVFSIILVFPIACGKLKMDPCWLSKLIVYFIVFFFFLFFFVCLILSLFCLFCLLYI